MLALGEFDTDNYDEENSEDRFLWLLFFAMTFLAQIVFLNMLIAVMGDSFDKVTEKNQQAALMEQINMLGDYVCIVPRET